MPFRFRRLIRVLPGLRLNLGKRSTSITFGGRGAHVTLRPGRTPRATVGLPGTGVSFTDGGKVARPREAPAKAGSGLGGILGAVLLVVLVVLVVWQAL